MKRTYELEIDEGWLSDGRSYYLYRGSEEISEVYVLREAIAEDVPTTVRLSIEWGTEVQPSCDSYDLELRKEMLRKVYSKYVYTSRDKIGSSQVIGGVYILRSVFDEEPPEVVHSLLEWSESHRFRLGGPKNLPPLPAASR